MPVFLCTGPPGSARTHPAPKAARSRELATVLCAEEPFGTDDDDDNRAAVRDVPADALALVGLAERGPRGDVDKVVKGLRPHP